MINQPLRGLPRLTAALKNSLAGFADAWKGEEAFRIEVILFVISLPLAVWLGENVAQIALLICSGLIVLIVEVLNTAIESIVDRIGPERHDLSRQAKDLGSTAVLFAALVPLITWGSILILNFS